MPRLGRILSEGAHGVLRSVIPPVTAPAWASFATGVNPGRHGCFNFLTMRSFGDFRPITSRDIKLKTFYETLVEQGYDCTLINLPASYPARIDKTVITSILSSGDDIVHPPELVEEIPLLAEYELIPEVVTAPRKDRDFRQNSDLIIKNEEVRFEVAKELFQRQWDFFFVLFSGCDWISHRVFAEMLSGQGSEAEGAREYFEKLDEWIGWFFDNMEQDALKMIVSDHGFKVCRGELAVNNWLEQRGFLSFKECEPGGEKLLPLVQSPTRARALKPTAGKIRKAILNNRMAPWAVPVLKRAFEKPGRFRRMLASDLEIDVEASKAICSQDGIFVRDDTGNSQKTIDELIVCLNELRDRFGVFREAARREDIYWGPYVGIAPAITLVDADFKYTSAGGETVFTEKPVPWHDKDGMWVLSGPDGVEGKESNASIMDIYPTVLDWVGVEPAHRPDGVSLLARLGVK